MPILSEARVEDLILKLTSRFYICIINVVTDYVDVDEVVGAASDLG